MEKQESTVTVERVSDCCDAPIEEIVVTRCTECDFDCNTIERQTTDGGE